MKMEGHICASGVAHPISAGTRDQIRAGLPEALATAQFALEFYLGVADRFEREIAGLEPVPQLLPRPGQRPVDLGAPRRAPEDHRRVRTGDRRPDRTAPVHRLDRRGRRRRQLPRSCPTSSRRCRRAAQWPAGCTGSDRWPG